MGSRCGSGAGNSLVPTAQRFGRTHTVTREVIYWERLGAAGQYSASPVIANDHLYIVSSKGVRTVVKCVDRFEIVHQADLKGSVAASPAMDQNTLLGLCSCILCLFVRLRTVRRPFELTLEHWLKVNGLAYQTIEQQSARL